jgi:hypothetical protein
LHQALDSHALGLLDTPNSRYKKSDTWVWAADNGCFNAKTFVGEQAWFEWLTQNQGQRSSCLFASLPDVVGSHDDTLTRSAKWFSPVTDLGYRPAFVIQDGATIESIPWGELGAVFIGGSTEFKLSNQARDIVQYAKSKSLHVHMGRVNSFRRFRYAQSIGVDTVDGTYIAFGPDINAPIVLRWSAQLNSQASLF